MNSGPKTLASLLDAVPVQIGDDQVLTVGHPGAHIEAGSSRCLQPAAVDHLLSVCIELAAGVSRVQCKIAGQIDPEVKMDVPDKPDGKWHLASENGRLPND